MLYVGELPSSLCSLSQKDSDFGINLIGGFLNSGGETWCIAENTENMRNWGIWGK